MKTRIFLKDLKSISNKESASVYGRITALTDNSFYITDETGEDEIFNGTITPGFKTGDIVTVRIKIEDKKPEMTSFTLLNSITTDPVSDRNSPFYKLNKNNKKLTDTLYKRQMFFNATRDFFSRYGFLELQTPALVESPGIEKHIQPFGTGYIDHSGNEKLLYLPTSPEFALKEALSAGLEKIFEIAKVFRNNGEDSVLHNPDFFMLEWYRAFGDYELIMEDCADYIGYLFQKLNKSGGFIRNGHICSTARFTRIKVKDLFKGYDIDLDNYSLDENKFIREISAALKMTEKNITGTELTKEDLFFKFFLTFIEPELGLDNPVIVYEYPAEMAALSVLCPDNPLYAKRFELYICGIEIANAYQELTDPAEQKRRFDQIIDFRNRNGKTPLKLPERFLNSLRYGMPPASGIALGIERLFMLFEGLDSIKDTNLFY